MEIPQYLLHYKKFLSAYYIAKACHIAHISMMNKKRPLKYRGADISYVRDLNYEPPLQKIKLFSLLKIF